jgi:hypothetical protein
MLVNYRPVLSQKRVPRTKKSQISEDSFRGERKIGCGSQMVGWYQDRLTGWLTVGRKITRTWTIYIYIYIYIYCLNPWLLRYVNDLCNVRFEVFTAVTMKNGVFSVFLRSVRRLLVTASVPSSPIPRCRFLQEPHGVASQKTPFFDFCNVLWALAAVALKVQVMRCNPKVQNVIRHLACPEMYHFRGLQSHSEWWGFYECRARLSRHSPAVLNFSRHAGKSFIIGHE